MVRGFVYLVAIMDWYSRKVLSWHVSNMLDTCFCVDVLGEEAVEACGVPEIFNTDQGSQVHQRRVHRRPQGISDQVWREQIAVKDRSIQGTNCT